MDMPSMFHKKWNFIKLLKLITVLITTLLLTQKAISTEQLPHTQILQINNNKIIVEVAETLKEQAQGLMNRTVLPEDHGMLFVLGENSIALFWMYHTLIPLDLIFIKDGKIIQISHNAQPCRSEDASRCARYPNDQGIVADAVLEVNAGYAIQNHIQEGDRVKLQILNNP